MKKTNLVDLMQRYVTGQVTEQEKKKIEAWLDMKKTEEDADLLLEPADEERLLRKIIANIDNEDEIKSFRPRGAVRKLFSNRWLQVAASLMILTLASYTIWFSATRTSPEETISGSGSEKAILDDGSIVWLQKESRLTYGDYGNARKATFTGEALFEVAKDPERPFTISCGPVDVEVVGTSFNLKNTAGVVELKVFTGKVQLSTASDKEGTTIHAQEMAVYTVAEGITKRMIDKNEIAAIVAPTEYNMEFRNTTMENVLAKIERKFDITIHVQDDVVKKCRITADFTDNSLKTTMEMLAELLVIEYTIKDNTVSISGKGCN